MIDRWITRDPELLSDPVNSDRSRDIRGSLDTGLEPHLPSADKSAEKAVDAPALANLPVLTAEVDRFGHLLSEVGGAKGIDAVDEAPLGDADELSKRVLGMLEPQLGELIASAVSRSLHEQLQGLHARIRKQVEADVNRQVRELLSTSADIQMTGMEFGEGSS